MEDIHKIRPTWVEVNLDHLIDNLKEVKRVTNKKTRICAVVKADAYGHGAPMIAKVLMENGADFLAVATLSEAIQIRKFGVGAPLLILGYTPDDRVEELIQYNIRQSVFSLEQAMVISNTAGKLNRKATIHIGVNTGMARLGFELSKGYDDALRDMRKIFGLPNIVVEGVFSHLAKADETDKSFSEYQYQRFNDFVKVLEEENGPVPIKHISNSAAAVDLPHMNMDMVRVGIILYGMFTSKSVSRDVITLKQVLELKSKVVDIRELPGNVGVSYNHKYMTEGKSKIVTIPVGFGDGLPRDLSGKISVYYQNHALPIIGNICMDYCMADATGIDIETGEVVTIYSEKHKGNSIDEIAEKANTINTEILTGIGKRVPRVYLKNNEVLKVVDHLLK